MPDRLIRHLAKGDPVDRVWPIYITIGAITFGFLSIPSEGVAVVLIPMFIVAGLATGYGCIACPRRGNQLRGRRMTAIGLGLMILASWTRGVVVWGLDQRGAGSALLASIVWVWITAGCAMLLISVWIRGLQT